MHSQAELATSIELAEITDENSFRTRQMRREQLQEEENRYREAIEQNPSSRRAHLDLAKFLFHQNEYDEATDCANKVLELDEANPNAFCLLGRIHGFGEPQDVEQAEDCFKRALELDDNYAKAHYFYAYLLRSRLERFDDAEVHYKRAMELRPDDVTSYNDCAIMLVRQKRCEEAKVLYEKVLELQPRHAIAHFNLANLLRKDLKDYAAAEKHFLIAIQVRPRFTAALNNYATMLHHQMHRYGEAEQYYLRAIQVDQKYARAHFNYANLCREHLKKYPTAEEHYLAAIDFDENNPNFHNNYGLLLQYSLRNYRQAKKHYEIALRLDDNHALGHCNYGTILMQMVDKKYNKTMEDDLSDEDGGAGFGSGLGGIGMGSDLSHNSGGATTNRKRKLITEERRIEYLNKSEHHFKRSIALNKRLVMAYNNYGCLLRRLERFDDAKEMFEKALEIDPKFTMASRNLQRSNEKMKEKLQQNGGNTDNIDDGHNSDNTKQTRHTTADNKFQTGTDTAVYTNNAHNAEYTAQSSQYASHPINDSRSEKDNCLIM